MSILAIDPGDEESALVLLESSDIPVAHRKSANEVIRHSLVALGAQHAHRDLSAPTHLAIEMIASYGMPVGREVFETCLWIGRFIEAWGGPFTLVYRKDVKMFLCGNTRAKDANIRQALIDLYGGKDVAIGKAKTPGPLHGLAGDEWAALGVGVTWSRSMREQLAKAVGQ